MCSWHLAHLENVYDPEFWLQLTMKQLFLWFVFAASLCSSAANMINNEFIYNHQRQAAINNIEPAILEGIDSNSSLSGIDSTIWSYDESMQQISRTDSLNFDKELAMKNPTAHKRTNVIANGNIPSLMTEMMKIRSHKDLCNPSGRNNALVRRFQNKGKVLFSEGSFTLLDLHYLLDMNLLKKENMAFAGIYASEDHYRGHQWTNRFSGSIFHYSIFPFQKHLNSHLRNLLLHYNGSIVSTQEKGKKMLSQLEELLGPPIALRTSSYDLPLHNDRSLDVTSLVKRWRQQSTPTFRMILAVNEFKKSEFFQTLTSSELFMQCFEPTSAVMVLVSCSPTDSSKTSNEQLHHRKQLISKKIQKENAFQPNHAHLKSFIHYHLAESRSKRSTRATICQRESMWVDFNDLGWSDWIIAPRAFQAYRCVGECPYPLSGRINSTNYAMLASMMNSVDPENSPMPCCVPTSLRPVSVLYLDNSDNVVLRNYEGMIVDGCGCR